jgi:DNA repair protein RadB
MIGGGLEEGIVTEVYGEGGSGKTSLALQAAVRCAEGGSKAVFVDAEGVSPERFRQIAGDDHRRVLKRILFFSPNSLEELDDQVSRAIKLTEGDNDVGLVVVDTVSVFYRQAIGTKTESASRSLITNIVVRLHRLGRGRGIPVLITNQVYFDPETGVTEPLGGQGIGHIAKTIVRLDRTAPGRRTAVLMKHRHRAEGEQVRLRVTDKGLEDA